MAPVLAVGRAGSFLSTLSLRRATLLRHSANCSCRSISIHALLAESDNLHPGYLALIHHFYPRSPCGERHLRVLDGSKSSIISIHALLAESDGRPKRLKSRRIVFLSTLSLRRATSADCNCRSARPISIHALLAESDNANLGRHRGNDHFYPRSPCGERQRLWTILYSCPDFYPRSPCGERQRLGLLGWLRTLISIHALLAESDRGGDFTYHFMPNFYPRSPCGERPGA